jgi:hypothetical protein
MPRTASRRSWLPLLLSLLTLAIGSGPATADGPATSTGPDPAYWRLDDVHAQVDAWQQQYPDLIHRTTLGSSGLGEGILLVRVSDNAAVSEPEPAVFFHGALHANECNGTGAVMHQIAALLAGYGHDPAVTARVDGLELWFAPILNPDGHRYVFGGHPHWADWRKTLRDNNDNGTVDFPDDGVDINRNWDWNWHEYDNDDPSSQKYKGPYPWSEPETVAAREFIATERPVVVVDYHSPVTITWHNYVFYPWVSQSGLPCPDYDIARDIADDWAAATRTLDGGSFHSIYAYDTLPKEQCWSYGKTGTLAFLMEIADQCWFTGAAVDTIAVRVARGSTALVDRVLAGPGIRGTVTHGITGEPMLAEVRILELHHDAIGPRYTEVEHGQFYRLTESGDYTVEVSLRDFESQTMPVTVGASGWAEVDVVLMPVATAAADVLVDADWLRIGGTVRGDRQVWLSLPAGLPAARVDLLDLRGRRVAVLGDGLVAGRPHGLRLPAGLADGVYLVQARSGGQRQVARLVYLD